VSICLGRVVRRFVFASACWSSSGLAADALNSSSKHKDEPQSSTDARSDQAEHTETNFVPVFGGSTDLGLGGGYFLGIARVKKGIDPYLWNIDSSGLITFKYSSGKLTVPYQDLYARLTIPRLFGAPLRLELRPSYTWESVDYFGMGNASSVAGQNTSSDHFKYTRGHPQFDVDVRGKIADHFAGHVGFRYIQNIIRVAADSKLADDQRTGSEEVKHLNGTTGSSAVVLFKYGLQWDTRDNETSSHRGSFDTLDVKLSPGGTTEFPYRYGEATLNLRGFTALGTERVTLAVRAVGDWMFGGVPFYELARFDDTYAVGGSLGVRGVPAQRYYGRLKALGNVELRLEAVSFHALGKPLVLGFVPFFDGGALTTKSLPDFKDWRYAAWRPMTTQRLRRPSSRSMAHWIIAVSGTL